MELTVTVERQSNIVRKLTVKVAAKTVSKYLEKGLVSVQKTAKIKGFRPGHVPLAVVKQYYGDDVRHQAFHDLIEDSYREALKEQKIQAVGHPKIETPKHQTGEGAHDHGVGENEDLSYTATVEVLPEIEVKNYTGLSLTKDKVLVEDKDVDSVIGNLRDSQAQLVPASSGLAMADGSQSSRPAQKNDFADIDFSGGVVTDAGIEEKEGMKGSRTIEIGSNSLIPGFEDELIGMRKGESKTFKIKFPKEYHDAETAGKDAQFSVTVNELKEKKLPELNEEFAKQLGYENLEDMRKRANDYLTRERAEQSDRKLRSDLLQVLIDKHNFEVPSALVQAQTRALAQDVAENLKNQKFTDEMIQQALGQELENLKKRADKQVRASLILEAIAKKENIEVKPEEAEEEITKMAKSMNTDEDRIRQFYDKNPEQKENLLFRIKEERVVKFLIEKSKIKEK